MLYPKDPKVRVERHDKTLKIEWNWGTKSGYICVAIAVLLAMVLWFVTASTSTPEMGWNIWSQLGFFFFVCLVTVFPLILMGLTSALNKTTIHADHERLIVRTAPIPWNKSRLIASKGIQQFFVGNPVSSQSVPGRTLILIDKDSHFVRLTSSFPSGFAAHQICHELQDWYGLEDLPVFGQNTLPHQPGPRSK
ncbi:MAG: hypothetical protein WCG75_03095 [Armatimonadota bacterium]